jgi:hypothetical protein
VIAEEAEGDVKRLGLDRAQGGIAERIALPVGEAVSDPIGQVEGDE